MSQKKRHDMANNRGRLFRQNGRAVVYCMSDEWYQMGIRECMSVCVRE